ncbi:hypothetical protein Tco_0570922 [Tanacetum coccineum]
MHSSSHDRAETSWKQVLRVFLMKVVVGTKLSKGIPPVVGKVLTSSQLLRLWILLLRLWLLCSQGAKGKGNLWTSVGGKSRYAIKRLLAGAVLNAEVGVAAIPTLPFVTASVSSTPKHEGVDHIDSMAGPNLCANVAEAEVNSLVRSFAPMMTIVTTVTATIDPTLVVKEKPVKHSMFFDDSSSAGGANPNNGVFLDLTDSDFLVSGIRIVIDPESMVDKFAPPKFFASVRGIEHDQLFTEFNVGAARQMSLSVREAEAVEAICLRAEASNFEAIEKSLRDETDALRERNVILEKEQNALDVKVTELEASTVNKGCELTNLNAQLTSVKSQNDNLVDRDASIEAVMSILRLEEPLADKLGLNELQPHVDQLMVPIHHSSDKVVIGATALSLALDVSSIRVKKIRENIANQRSALRDVFVPLAEPFSAAVLIGTEGIYDIVDATAGLIPMAPITIFSSASTLAPISVDGLPRLVGTDDQTTADENAEPFPNVDDAELNIPQ